ncbi:hypothetical protein G7059_07900 [Erysipelothrix sp. HDW6A]|uniref:hypothetical protein n=1 Tax=Erysipelothrix sp. HDW6A TaxID=2714928 RepID=UPI0014086DDF|nr:hypothetical protein [Erysipelothrix sp. HDW6A]QIK57766.1 hypothetical protein G7059_07900 [Erysipelothrix sp. HDW6A]
MQLDYYWNLTPNQFIKHLDVFKEKEINKAKFADEIAHLMGLYVLQAFNDPKKYPKEPYHSQTKHTTMSDDDMERIARRNTIMLGGEIDE